MDGDGQMVLCFKHSITLESLLLFQGQIWLRGIDGHTRIMDQSQTVVFFCVCPIQKCVCGVCVCVCRLQRSCKHRSDSSD